MRLRSGTASLILLMSLVAVAAHAKECPAKSTGTDDIAAALNEAPSCDKAMSVFQACQSGAGGDVALGAIVSQKCESDFLARLEAPQKRVYQRRLRACDRKYRDESGSMYRSFEAFCRANVAQRYSHKALKIADPKSPR
jgi:hypothetical protein